MPNNTLEITTICSDVENSQFTLQSTVPEEEMRVENTTPVIHPQLSQRRSLPRIKILGTGGTIASKAASSSATADYKVDLTIQDMLDSIPDISRICEVEYEQICNVDSKNIDEPILLKIYNGISESLQKFDGIVITHGTDSLAETAFFIESTIDAGEVPIVFVGSMRPSSSVSADGPMNLYQAICIAADSKSRNRGVLVSLNDQISAGYYITKTNANSLDSFNVRQGYLGNFVNNEIHYYYPPVKPQGCHKFKLNIPTGTESFNFPDICIIYGHQGITSKLLNIVKSEYQGIVIATMGAGSMPDDVNVDCLRVEIPIVYSKRSMDGMIPRANLPRNSNGDSNMCIASGYLSPEKSRILLQLCLACNYGIDEIRHVFRGVYGG